MAAPSPGPTASAAQGPAYSIEVPNSDASSASSYLRVGAPDLTSQREASYYGSAIDAQLPAIVMWSPTDIKFVAASTTIMKTSAESLVVAAVGTQVVNSAYSYAETGTFRDMSYKISHATSWSIGDSESWSLASSTAIGISNSQSVAIGASIGAKVAADVKLELGLMSVTADKDGIDIKSILGTYKTAGTSKLSGAKDIAIAVTPVAQIFLRQVTTANDVMMRLTAFLATVAGGAMTGMGVPVLATEVNATTNKVDVKYETQIKEWSKRLAGTGLASIAMLSVSQALYVTLGTVGATMQGAPMVGLFPKITMDSISINFEIGLSKINMTPNGISIQCGPASFIDVTPNAVKTTSPDIACTAGVSSAAFNVAGVTIAGPTIALNGTASVRATAATVSLQGTVGVTANAPAVTFGP